MEKAISGLAVALALKPREHIALVGGGGKTSLMFALAEELRGENKRVVTSTTTKVWHREAGRSPSIILTQSGSPWRDTLRDGLKLHGHVFLGQILLDSGKIKGINPHVADNLYMDEEIDYLLVEADGSAGHPVKAPAEHEPIIPSSVTRVIAILGLEALDKPLDSKIVFREDIFKKITGINEGAALTPFVLSKLFLDPGGLFKGTPVTAKKTVFLNKLDLLEEERNAIDMANHILAYGGREFDRVLIGSIERGIYLVKGRKDGKYIPQAN